MRLTEDTTYKINKVRVLQNSYYLFDLYDDIYVLTRSPLFKYILQEKEGTIREVHGELELYLAKKSRKSGDLILVDKEHRKVEPGNSYTIVTSSEDIVTELL